MKKSLIAVLLGLSTFGAVAGPYYHDGRFRYHDHGHGRNNWVAPLVIGGVIGYALTRPQPVYVQPEPVYSSVPPAPYGYRYEQLLDGNCNCYRWVLVPN